MTDQHHPEPPLDPFSDDPAERAAYWDAYWAMRRTRAAWIEAHLSPGERLEDFLPPPAPPRGPVPQLRRPKIRPAWQGLLWAALGLACWPLVAFAASWAALGAFLWCLGWCFWPRPRVQRWKPPRELPPYPGDLVAASWRRRPGDPREGDLYRP
jgi:hypothetical protein